MGEYNHHLDQSALNFHSICCHIPLWSDDTRKLAEKFFLDKIFLKLPDVHS